MNKDCCLYLVRHGATELNNDTDTSVDRIRGWKDVPLSKEGVEEANKVGKQLKDKGIKHIYSSDLSRAHETAKIIGGYLKVTPKPTKGLRPWDLGEFTGKSTKESLPEIEKYAKDDTKEVPKGEAFRTFKDRALSQLDDIINNHRGETVAVVTHHRVERLFDATENKTHKDAKMDMDKFLSKGEKPGSFEKFNVTPSKESALKTTIRKSINEVKK